MAARAFILKSAPGPMSTASRQPVPTREHRHANLGKSKRLAPISWAITVRAVSPVRGHSFMRDLISLPSVNATVVDAGISMGLPVCGCLPVRAPRRFLAKVPNPG